MPPCLSDWTALPLKAVLMSHLSQNSEKRIDKLRQSDSLHAMLHMQQCRYVCSCMHTEQAPCLAMHVCAEAHLPCCAVSTVGSQATAHPQSLSYSFANLNAGLACLLCIAV
ncbi:TPA: hypothetical protein ACH3X1_016795 [Trebouxia sp. C0004]